MMENQKTTENKLRDYILKKYGRMLEDTMSLSSIIKYTKKEMYTSKCEMCQESLLSKKSFVYEPSLKYLTNSEDMVICENCAKREHGSKNRYKWKDLISDLENKNETKTNIS